MSNPDYRKMFEDLKPYYPEPKDLNYLATVMSGRASFPDATGFVEHWGGFFKEDPKPIPAGYTYLAQFIIHDISFDERSDRHIREDLPFWGIASPEFIKNLKNLRKPNFDLETVYGYENPTNRGEIPRRELMLEKYPLPLLKLGMTEGLGADPGNARLPFPNDLPRGIACVEARIVDPRNDENLLLAQTLVAFIKFHNAMVAELSKSEKYKDGSGNYKSKELFEKARKLTIRYYQTIVLTDFLPRIVQESVIKDVIAQFRNKKLFYQPDMFIPLEFSVAAFRFGHSMIREKYNLNVKHIDESPPLEDDNSVSLGKLMMFTGRGDMDSNSLAIRLKLPSIWIINWNLFYETDGSVFTSKEKIRNNAEPINTGLPIALLRLRPQVEDPEGRASSLAALDLFRGRRFGFPTGQDVAEKIGVTPLDAKQIGNLIMRKEISIKEPTLIEVQKFQEAQQRARDAFSKKTPLWFYILAEAEIQAETDSQNAGKLGAVGSRIVAETIIQLLYYSEYSILRQGWEDDERFLLKKDEFFDIPEINTFDMPEMLRFVQKMNKEHFDKLYPNEFYPNITKEFDELNPLENI